MTQPANDNFLARDAQELQTHIESVLRDFPELADDDELAADTFEGLGLNDFLDKALAVSLEAKTMSAAIADRIGALRSRQDRFNRKDQAMRALMFRVMQAAGLPRVQLTEATLSVTKPRESVEVYDVNSLPAWAFVVERKPSKKDIGAALGTGKVCPGARMVTGEPGLLVRGS